MIKAVLSRIVFFFLYLLSLLPLWFLYILSDIVYILVFYIIGYRRGIVQENLRNSFPQKTAAELLLIEKKYFRYLGDLMVETIKLITISASQVQRRMRPTNPELLVNYAKQGRSVIATVGHYCNWELALYRASMYADYKTIIIYKSLTNLVSNGYYKQVRERFGAMLVPMKSTLRKLAELKNITTFTVLAADQTPVHHETQYYTTFLNQPTAFFTGPEKISAMFNSVIVFVNIRCVKRGYYEYELIPLSENPAQTQPYEITNLYIKQLETMISNEPQYWLWSHRRWKFKPGGGQ